MKREFIGNASPEELNTPKFTQDTHGNKLKAETGPPQAATWRLQEDLETQGKVGVYKIIEDGNAPSND